MRYLTRILLWLFVSSCAFAQQVSKADWSDLSLEKLMNLQISVATKTEQTLAEAPSSVTVFTRTEIQNMGITTLRELLNYVPGYQATLDVQNGSITAIGIRGRLKSDQSTDVLILQDGVRLNNSHSGGATTMKRLISLDNIKQVEIIRGPGSALYGSNAFLGVINLVTERNTNELIGRIGNLNSKDMAISLAQDIEDWHLTAFLRSFSDDGQVYEDIEDTFGVIGDTTDPQNGMDMDIRLSRGAWSFNTWYTERNFKDFLQWYRLGNGTGRDKSYQGNFVVNYNSPNIIPDSSLNVEAGYTLTKWDALGVLQPTDPVVFTEAPLVGGPYLTNYNAFLSSDLNYHPGTNFEWHFGITLEKTANKDPANVLNYDLFTGGLPVYLGDTEMFFGDASFVSDADRDIIGIFIQNKWDITTNLNLTSGIRYDNYSDFGDTLNPRAALTYRTPFDSTLKAMYGQAFRAPNFSELYNRNNPVFEGNPDLEPEEIETIEFAWIQRFGNIQTVVTYFDNEVDHIIFQPVNGEPTRNEGTSSSAGFEIELNGDLGEHLNLRSSYTRITDGESAKTPDEHGSIILNLNYNDFNANIHGIWRSDIPAIPNQSSYSLWGASLRYRLYDQLTLQSSIQNLTDKDYVTVSNATPSRVPNRGRTYQFSATFSF